MTTIVPEGEKIRRAIRWISDERVAHPGLSGTTLAQAAAFQFDLSPAEAEWLIATFREPPARGLE
jgi:hypothetical protein